MSLLTRVDDMIIRFNNTFTRYCLIGIINTLVGYGIIFSLLFLNVNYIVSNSIGYAVGISVSYYLNKFHNFKSTGKPVFEFPRFCTVCLTGYALNILILMVLVEFFHINTYYAVVIAGVAYTVTTYLVLRSFVFVHTNAADR